jgi:integrase
MFLDRVKKIARTADQYEGSAEPDIWHRVFTPVKGGRTRSLTWAEYQQLMGKLMPQWQIVLTFSVYTGAEKSVCQRILTEHVRPEEWKVWLEGTKYRARTKRSGKKLYRQRYVHLTDDMILVIEDILKRREEVLLAAGMDPEKEERLFPYFRDTGFATALKKACEKLGWVTDEDKFVHHDARHVFGTWRVLAGHDEKTVSFELGESPGSKMLRDVYSEVTSEHIFPPEGVGPLAHGYEWKVLGRSRKGGEKRANRGLGQIWDKKEGPVRVGELL